MARGRELRAAKAFQSFAVMPQRTEVWLAAEFYISLKKS